MSTARAEREPVAPEPAPATGRSAPLPPGLGSPQALLSLQRAAGNQAVGRLLAERLQRSSSSSGGSGGSSGSSGSSGGGDGGAAPAPAPSGTPDPARCRVDVRATHIGGFLSGAPVWHLYIVHTDDVGNQTGWRGGPSGGGSGGFGSIIGTTGAYAPGFVDWDPAAPSVTVGSGAGVCGSTTCFDTELRRIDATATPYDPTGPNSNTWVKTLLTNCSLTVDKPVWIAPGFGDPAL
jgi:hypothetical protein